MASSPFIPSTPITASSVDGSDSASASSTPASPATDVRPNEHLAVLIPRDLWKPDSAATRCDTFECRTRFGLFERRHHCRMCGGVFCQACSSRATTLLDASALELSLPRRVSITAFRSATSPVVLARVCDACHDSLHGRRPRPALAMPAPRPSAPVRIAPLSTSPSLCSSIATPPDGGSLPARRSGPAPPPRRRQRTASTASRASGGGIGSALGPSPRLRAAGLLPAPRPLTLEEVAPEYANVSFGELDAYPLRFSSAICKATGGGRWTPKTPPTMDCVLGKPGTKDFLVVNYVDEEDLADRRRRASPIIVHGEFKYRFPASDARPRAPIPAATF